MSTVGATRTRSSSAVTDELDFTVGELRRVRSLVGSWAHRAGLSRRRADELTVVVHELAANSVDHGGGRGTVRSWLEHGSLVIEVSDTGRLADPEAAGRTPPSVAQHRGRGLWIVRQLADAFEIRPTAHGTTYRVVAWR